MIEQIVSLENLDRSGSGFYFFRTHAGAEIDLLIDRGQTRIGFEFKAGVPTTPADWGASASRYGGQGHRPRNSRLQRDANIRGK